MQRCLIALLLLTLTSAAPTPRARDTSIQYTLWAAEHGRAQSPSRMKTFAANLALIESHDAEAAGYSMSLNAFADLTLDEFVSVVIRKPMLPAHNVAASLLSNSSHIDWRAQGKVNPVHDIAAMGCSIPDTLADAVASAEAIHCKRRPLGLQQLSTNQLAECAAGSEGCSGFTSTFEDYVVQKGLLTAADYDKLPGEPGVCRLNATTPTSDLECNVTEWVAVLPNDSEQLQAAVAKQPVVVLVNAASQAFQFYRSGILSGDCPSQSLDHSMVVVGFGSEQGHDTWIVKNNWGTSWGDQGYVVMSRESAKGPGQCGIAAMPTYPKIQ